MRVTAKSALFIKLGPGGGWADQCIEDGILKIGYRELSHGLCEAGKWPAVEREARDFARSQGAAKRHVKQIRLFYESDRTTVWVTFHSNRLWWCRTSAPVEQIGNNKVRKTLDGWHDKDAKGAPLLKAVLSGRLLATEGFQGTICSIAELDYLLHRLNGMVEPHVLAAQRALSELTESLVPIVQGLHHKDFETLADLIFRQAGWQRTGVAGGTTKDIDLDLLSPLTGERAAVQIKSRAGVQTYERYRRVFTDMRGYTRFYFITHSPDERLRSAASEEATDSSFFFWDERQLAEHAARYGLAGWLLDKAA